MGMNSYFPLTYWLVLATVGVNCLLKGCRYGMQPKGYPPSPPTLPITGNLHQMPMENVHIKFQQWAKQYGPVVSLKLRSQTLILLNTDYIVKDLLDKRSQNICKLLQCVGIERATLVVNLWKSSGINT
ncbi:hypothetical protein V2W45_1425396 [Cenococcum geophilum]